MQRVEAGRQRRLLQASERWPGPGEGRRAGSRHVLKALLMHQMWGVGERQTSKMTRSFWPEHLEGWSGHFLKGEDYRSGSPEDQQSGFRHITLEMLTRYPSAGARQAFLVSLERSWAET